MRADRLYPRPFLAGTGAILVFVAGLACGRAPEVLGEHPSQEAMVRNGPPADIIRFDSSRMREAAGSTGPPRNTWRLGSPLTTLGAFTAPVEQVFGAIVGVAHDAHGRLFILDSQARLVRIFDDTGTHVHSIGGHGAGPGEFLGPQALVIPSDGRLLVGDYTGDVSLFRIEDGSVRFSHFLRHEGDLWDMCAIGDHLYVHGMRPGLATTVHAYTMDGDRVRSFAEVYRTRNRIIQRQLSRGRIACFEDAGVILVAPNLMPEVRAYDAAGTLLWWIGIEDFLTLPLSETVAGGSRMRFPERGWHLIVGVVSWNQGDAALLQVGWFTPGSRGRREPFARLHTFVLSIDPPGGRYLGDAWPRILLWDEGRVYAMREQPHPALVILPVAVTH